MVVLDKSSPKRSRSVPHDILRDIDVPVIWCDCVSGKGLDELRSTVYQIFKNDEAAMMGTGQETQNTIFKVSTVLSAVWESFLFSFSFAFCKLDFGDQSVIGTLAICCFNFKKFLTDPQNFKKVRKFQKLKQKSK